MATGKKQEAEKHTQVRFVSIKDGSSTLLGIHIKNALWQEAPLSLGNELPLNHKRFTPQLVTDKTEQKISRHNDAMNISNDPWSISHQITKEKHRNGEHGKSAVQFLHLLAQVEEQTSFSPAIGEWTSL